MAILLGIDTGGTYTDAVLFDDRQGVLRTAKSLTTREDLAVGVRGAVDAVLREPPPEPVVLVSLSTTLATNALVEGHGSPVCLLLVGQPPGILERASLREALGSDPVVFIAGGHGATGDEQAPLDLDAVRAAVEAHAPQVSAFAVAGYFAVRNNAHEVAVREVVHELCALPVTCSHELANALDAPRRALTALLNARLVHLLDQLVRAVAALLAERGIEAPLMVVKGDGSLISAEEALHRPVETILSGPAASLVGAHHLCGEDDVLVSDIGGTTTDVALLRGGRPALDSRGATVGGWRTMVEAVAVHTFGLGGDSETHWSGETGLHLGPRRAVPLSLLATSHPGVIEQLHEALEAYVPPLPRFALRLRPLSYASSRLTRFETRIWEQLEHGPVSVAALAEDLILARSLNRLVARGLVAVAAFTPSDASHILGRQRTWNAEAAELGAQAWVRHLAGIGRQGTPVDAQAFALAVVERMTLQSGTALLRTAFLGQGLPDLDSGGELGRALVTTAMSAPTGEDHLLSLAVRLNRPLVAIGAPAHVYYDAVAERLGTRLVVPPHAEVCNAVGAVASGVLQTVRVLITSPQEGTFRVHAPSGVQDFEDLERAAGFALEEASREARAHAVAAGAAEIRMSLSRRDRVASGVEGRDMFIESHLCATAAGRPRHAR